MANCVPTVTGKATTARTVSPGWVDLLMMELTRVSGIDVPCATVTEPAGAAGVVGACGMEGACGTEFGAPDETGIGVCAPQTEAMRSIAINWYRIKSRSFPLPTGSCATESSWCRQDALALSRLVGDGDAGDHDGRRRAIYVRSSGASRRSWNNRIGCGGSSGDHGVRHARPSRNRNAGGSGRTGDHCVW